MQIAIDGPAGAGKSTVATEIAAALNFKYIDTGAMYRALGVALRQAGVDTKDREAVAAALPGLDVEVSYRGDEQLVAVNGRPLGEEIRSKEAALAASDVAVVPEVRLKLVDLQRRAAQDYDVVMDGRDIGTYVLPDADFKFFLTATPRARAERRHQDLLRLGQDVSVDVIEAEITARDRQDMERSFAPLIQTEEQTVIDTTDMTQHEAAERMLRLIRGQV